MSVNEYAILNFTMKDFKKSADNTTSKKPLSLRASKLDDTYDQAMLIGLAVLYGSKVKGKTIIIKP